MALPTSVRRYASKFDIRQCLVHLITIRACINSCISRFKTPDESSYETINQDQTTMMDSDQSSQKLSKQADNNEQASEQSQKSSDSKQSGQSQSSFLDSLTDQEKQLSQEQQSIDQQIHQKQKSGALIQQGSIKIPSKLDNQQQVQDSRQNKQVQDKYLYSNSLIVNLINNLKERLTKAQIENQKIKTQFYQFKEINKYQIQKLKNNSWKTNDDLTNSKDQHQNAIKLIQYILSNYVFKDKNNFKDIMRYDYSYIIDFIKNQVDQKFFIQLLSNINTNNNIQNILKKETKTQKLRFKNSMVYSISFSGVQLKEVSINQNSQVEIQQEKKKKQQKLQTQFDQNNKIQQHQNKAQNTNRKDYSTKDQSTESKTRKQQQQQLLFNWSILQVICQYVVNRITQNQNKLSNQKQQKQQNHQLSVLNPNKKQCQENKQDQQKHQRGNNQSVQLSKEKSFNQDYGNKDKSGYSQQSSIQQSKMSSLLSNCQNDSIDIQLSYLKSDPSVSNISVLQKQPPYSKQQMSFIQNQFKTKQVIGNYQIDECEISFVKQILFELQKSSDTFHQNKSLIQQLYAQKQELSGRQESFGSDNCQILALVFLIKSQVFQSHSRDLIFLQYSDKMFDYARRNQFNLNFLLDQQKAKVTNLLRNLIYGNRSKQFNGQQSFSQHPNEQSSLLEISFDDPRNDQLNKSHEYNSIKHNENDSKCQDDIIPP